MKIFLDTANVNDIRAWSERGIVDGVTTNPTHLSKYGGDPRSVVEQICALLPEGDISVEVTQHEPNKVYEQARAIARIASNVIVKIPCHVRYYATIKRLVSEGIRLNITLVFSVAQGLAMAKLGVQYISPFMGRLDDIGQDGLLVVRTIHQMIKAYGYTSQTLAASVRTIDHIQAVIALGVPAITLPVALLEQATAHALTDKGMALFDADWQKLAIDRFP